MSFFFICEEEVRFIKRSELQIHYPLSQITIYKFIKCKFYIYPSGRKYVIYRAREEILYRC